MFIITSLTCPVAKMSVFQGLVDQISNAVGFDVARLSGIGAWVVFWFVCNAVCYWFVGAFVTRSKERGRLALRAVSIVHAAMAVPELAQTIQMWNEGEFFF